MRFLFIVALVAMVASGCTAFSEVDAQFVGYNSSNDNISVIVDGVEYSITANQSLSFVVKVPIPRNPVGYQTGPSSVDKVTRVSVAVRNLRTGLLLPPATCDAGAKLRTYVRYEGTFQSVRCDYSW